MREPCTVLVLTRTIGGFFAGEVLVGITREVTAAGGRVLVVQATEPDDETDHLGAGELELPIALGAVDAVISVAPSPTAPYLRRAQLAGLPVVLASDALPGIEAPVAMPDNRSGVRAAVDHLRAHGHTRIAFVGDMSQEDFRERRAAYDQATADHGVAAPDLFVEAANYGELGGRVAADNLLATLAAHGGDWHAWADRPTAVVAATDENAFGLIRGLEAAGIRVPHDLAVVGFDNVEHAVFSVPSLSTVHQRFDEVGALAARLALAMLRGEHVPVGPQVAAASVLIPRGSCGCRHDILDDRPAAPDLVGLPATQDELHAMLHTTLDRRAGGRLAHEDVATMIESLERVLAADSELEPHWVPELLDLLRGLAPDAEHLRQVVGTLTEYLQRLAAMEAGRSSGRTTRGVAALTAAMWEFQAYGAVQQGHRRETSVLEHGNVASELLHADPRAVRELGWMGQTHIRAGLLALWDGPPHEGRLRITGMHDTTGTLADHTGAVVPVEQFPPADLVALADPARNEIPLVVPVRTNQHDWGLLAVLAVVNTGWSREPYRHWANVLCLAFEAELLEDAMRASEERYAYAARAANDGLWELDLVGSGGMFMTPRCRAMTGMPADTAASVEAWLARIHPDDRDRVTAVFQDARAHPDSPVQVEYRVLSEGGRYRWVLSRGLAIARKDGTVHRIVGSLSDVDTRHELEEQLRQGALYDDVTGLPNRRLFLDRLDAAIKQASRRPEITFAVIFLDLDGFKLVNDSLGHLQGDELLRAIAQRLRSDLRAVDTAARFGGDEFAVLLTDPLPDEVLVIARRIQERLAMPLQLDGHEVSVTASVGIATSESGYTEAEDVLRDADIAMYHAKDQERGTASVFDRVMHVRAASRLRARGELRTALAERQFVVHYQPIVALDGSPVAHFEALVRWQHPERGLLPPPEFLPAMEDNTTILTLGSWIIDEVCRQVAQWRREHGVLATVSVNLSHREFWRRELPTIVTDALRLHDVPAESLVMEITESVIMTDPDAARRHMMALRDTGVHLHIDDFGTGHSSLAALRTFPVDALKIDGSFVRELDVVAQTTELVRIIIDMSAALGMEVVAECVETHQQADRLYQMGCGNAQGWLYAKALPGDDAGRVLGTHLGVPVHVA